MSKPNLKLPRLNKGARFFLYLSALLLCALSVLCVTAGIFPMGGSIAVYSLAFCLLLLSVCCLVSSAVRRARQVVRALQEKHPRFAELTSDYRRRSFVLSAPGSVLNLVFAIFNGVIGICSQSAWYVSLAVYYILLFLMRARILHYEFLGQNKTEEAAKPLREWQMYRRCGGVLLLASIALSGVVVLIVRNGHGRHYPGYLIYVVALYTFWKVISSVRNILKARKLKVPLLSCARNICCADALVSILSLETAMLASFSQGDTQFDTILVEITGSVVCVLVILIGCLMLISGSRQVNRMKAKNIGGDSP